MGCVFQARGWGDRHHHSLQEASPEDPEASGGQGLGPGQSRIRGGVPGTGEAAEWKLRQYEVWPGCIVMARQQANGVGIKADKGRAVDGEMSDH